MIPNLRRKFISITAATMFAVILLIIAAINGIFIVHTDSMLDTRLRHIMNTHISADNGLRDNFRQDTQPPPQSVPSFPDKDTGFSPPFHIKLSIRYDGCLIYLNHDGTVKEILQDAAQHYSEEELQTLASNIYHTGKDHGWMQYFKFHLEYKEMPNGHYEIKLGLLNASSDLYAVFTMLLISVSIGIFSFLLMLLIIIIASGKAVKPIEESYARQKQFVTDAGHELKTPLTVISADNALARMIYGDCEWFDSIDVQIEKTNGLIRNLITLARMDEEQSPVLAAFSFSDAVYDTAKSFQHLAHLDDKFMTLHIADNITYVGDESKLRQLVSILIDNAIKYCDKNGTISVTLTADKQIRLQVINDYAHAADCDLSRVFERFYRADKARTPNGSYGLGLAIAKSITELHKGEIHARTLNRSKFLFEVLLHRSTTK